MLLKTGGSALMCSSAGEAQAPLPGGWNASELTLERACSCCRCRARWGASETASRSPRASGATGRSCCTRVLCQPAGRRGGVHRGLNRAVDLLAQKAAGGGVAGAGTPAAIKTFEHADGPISVRDGRYGPYVNQGKVNATLPKTLKPEDVTLEQALALLAERAAKGGGARKAPAKKAATAKKAPAKKAQTRTAAKKTAGKAAAADA